MKKAVFSVLLVTNSLISSAFAQQSNHVTAPPPVPLKVIVGGIENGKPIDNRFAYCVPDGKGKIMNGGNISPSISWSGAPSSTRSYVVLVVDPDVPASFENANKEDKIIPENFARQDFYHWVLIDIPANTTSIVEGASSNEVLKQGKPAGKASYGVNGKNSYPDGGYDGPCPPWNDERMHNYHFIVYALDVPTLNLSGDFTGQQVMAAIQGHIWAKGEVVGTFTNNPKVRK